jgi:hypothetical protein
MKRGLVVYPGSGQIDGVAGDQVHGGGLPDRHPAEVDEIVGALRRTSRGGGSSPFLIFRRNTGGKSIRSALP